MRFFEFRQTLDELNMSPGNLKSMAAKIEGALVGMEFEMVVPGVEVPDEFEREPELDISQDRRIRVSTWGDLENEITDFFSEGEFSSGRGQITRALEKASDDFLEWANEIFALEQENGGLERWWKENNGGEEMPEPGTPAYSTAEDEYRDQFYNDIYNSRSSLRDWLEYSDCDTFLNFSETYNLQWPHITFNDPETTDEISFLASEFSDAVGLDVDVSTSYHGQKKSTKNFTIEPDGSIHGDGAGLEFVSPPLPIDQMIDVLGKTISWAKKRGCETNRSTGLHMNVSVPNYDLENLDYVKLALFVGDDWVANQFGRLGASYADSSMDKIKGRIQVNPTEIPMYLDKMKAGLNKIASKIIHSNQTEKYVSLNIQSNRLEFRSPGGDWLNQDINKLINTMLRFVVALDIACDPAKFKREYDTKLYKLIAGATPGADNTIKYFALYSSGQIPKAVLMSHLRQAKMIRQDKKKPPAPRDPNLKEYDIMYNASDDDYQEMHERVEAKSKEEAIQIFKRQNPEAVVLSIKQLNQPFNPKSGEYIVRMKENPNSNEYSISVNADSPRDAQEQIRRAYGPNTIIISVARG